MAATAPTTEEVLAKFDQLAAMLSNVDEYFADVQPEAEHPHYSMRKSITPELAAFLNQMEMQEDSKPKSPSTYHTPTAVACMSPQHFPSQYISHSIIYTYFHLIICIIND